MLPRVTESIDRALLQDVIKGDYLAVKQILENTNVRLDNVRGFGALRVASLHGKADMLRLLVTRPELNVNEVAPTDFVRNTALHFTAENGHVEATRVLLSRDGIDVTIKNSEGRNALEACEFITLGGSESAKSAALKVLKDAGILKSFLLRYIEALKRQVRLPVVSSPPSNRAASTSWLGFLAKVPLQAHEILPNAEFLLKFTSKEGYLTSSKADIEQEFKKAGLSALNRSPLKQMFGWLQQATEYGLENGALDIRIDKRVDGEGTSLLSRSTRTYG